jgi:hypothetical protein
MYDVGAPLEVHTIAQVEAGQVARSVVVLEGVSA